MMAAQVELDTGRPGVGVGVGVGVGARLLLGPLATSSNTSLRDGLSPTSACPQATLILGPEPGKPLPGPKPRLTPKPFAVDKNPTIRPILAPKPQPKPRPDASRQPHSLKLDPPSNPKPPLVGGGVASKPRPAPTSTQTSTNTTTAAAKPASGFQAAKPGLKPSTGQTSKPVAQAFKPAPPFTPSSSSTSSSSSSSVSAEARKPLPASQVSKRPVGAAPAVPQKKPGIHAPPGTRSSAEWSGSSRQKTPGPSTMTRAKSMGFLMDVGLTEEDRVQRVGGTSGRNVDRGSGAKGGVVAASSSASSSSSAAVPMRPHGRAGTRPRPVSAIFLPGSTVPDAQNSSGGGSGGSISTAGGAGPRWMGRRPLSADLTSKFEAAGFSVHQKAARMGSMENLAEQTRAENQNQKEEEEEERAGWARAGGGVTEGRTREEKERRGSGDGKEDQSKASFASSAAAQERVGDGRGTQEVGESQEEVRGGGSIKRRISLLLDSSTATLTVPTAAAAASRTSADGVEARTAAQPITDADKAIGVKQRIRELSEDTPLSQSPPQRLGVKPRPLPRDFTKRFGSDKTLDVPTTPTDESKGPPPENEQGDPLGKPGDAAPSAQTSVLQGDRKEAQQEVGDGADGADPSSSWRVPEWGRRPASDAHGTGPGVGVQTVRASLFENVVERHSVQMMMDDGRESTAGPAATARGAARNSRPGRSISLRGRGDLQGTPTSSIFNSNINKNGDGDDYDDGSLVMAVYREPASPSSPECVEHMFETVPGAGEKRAVSESVALAPLEERALTLRTRRSEGGAAAQRDLDLTSRPELRAKDGGPEWHEREHRLGQEVGLGTNGADEPNSPRYLRVGSLQRWGVVDATEPESGGKKSDMVRMMEEEIQRQLEIQRAAAAELEEEEEEEEQVEDQQQQQHDVGRAHIMNPPHVDAQWEWGREMEMEREREREDIAAPKRPKMLEGGEQQQQPQPQQPATKPRATYFALTGQIQESQSGHPTEGGGLERTTLIGGGEGRVVSVNVPYEDFSLRSGRVDSQGKVIPLRRNPSLDAAFSKSPQQPEPQKPPGGGDGMRWAAKEMKSGEQSGGDGRRDKRTMDEAMEAERRLLQEFEKKREQERERERQREAERRREAEKEKERQREMERQREAEKERQKEVERQKELQRQKEAERQRELEKERQRKAEYEKRKAAEKELERQREAERERQKEYEREKERMLDQERLRLREFERQKELERLKELERQREIERQRQLELERQREIERLKQLEMERQKALELERQREAERVKQLEIERQKALERERQRQKELEAARQRELERQREIERQKEIERRQKELERQRQLELDRQRDLERQRQLELDRQRQKELEKQKEMEKQKAMERWKEAEKQKEIERERQRELDEFERLKELERQRLVEFERKKEQQQQHAELKQQEQQRQQRRKERDESSDRRKQQELERQNKAVAAAEREKRSSESPLRPKVLDLDAVSLGDRAAPVRTPTEQHPSARWRQPSARAEEPYRPAILDIDSFKSQQAQPAPSGEVFPVAGFQSLPENSGTTVRSQGQPQPQPQTPEWARPQPSFPQQPTPQQQTQPLAPPQYQMPSAQPVSLDWTRVPAAPHQQHPQAQPQPQFQPFTPDWTKISPPQPQNQPQPQPQPQPQQPTSQYTHHHHQTQPLPQYPPPYQHHHTQPLTPDWTKSQTSGQPLTPDWTKAQASGQPLTPDWTKSQTPGQPFTPDWTKAQSPGQPLMPSPLHVQQQQQQQQPQPQSVNSEWARPQPAPQSAPYSLPQPVASVIQAGNRASALAEPDWLAGPRSGTGAGAGVAWPASQADVWQPRRDEVASDGSWFPADPSRRSGGGVSGGVSGGAVSGPAKVGTDQAPHRPLIPSLPPPLIPLPASAPAPTPAPNPAASLNPTAASALSQTHNPNTGPYAAQMQPYTPTPSSTQAPSQAPDRRWVAFPGESDFAGALPTQSSHSSSAFGGYRKEAFGHHGGQESGTARGANMNAASAAAGLTEPMAWERTAPFQRPEGRAARREPGQQELSRIRSRSVSRRSAPCESSIDASSNRMRSRSAHRDKARQSWGEQLKQCVSGEQEPKDTDTLVQETDSQYGTWETGLRTDDSLTPATPSSDSISIPTPSPRKLTPPHTPGEQATPSSDTPDGSTPSPEEPTEPLPFPEASTALLDSSAMRSRVQLSKKRNRRAPPSRAARHSALLTTLPETQYQDSAAEQKAEPCKQEDSDSELKPRAAPSSSSSSSSQPQRVALFPGMDPSALKAQLKRRGDGDGPPEGAVAPSPSQLSRSPKSPFLPRASRVLPPPTAGKENGEEASPQWLKELKTKKRLSQYENDS